MSEIYLKYIFRMLFLIAANAGGRQWALQIQKDLDEEIKSYDERIT